MSATLPDRVRKYLAKVEPALDGQHGHNTLLKASRILVWDFALSPQEAWPYALEYNARCMPPWSERDLHRKLIQALLHPRHEKPRGHLLGNGDCFQDAARTIVQFPKPEPPWPTPD